MIKKVYFQPSYSLVFYIVNDKKKPKFMEIDKWKAYCPPPLLGDNLDFKDWEKLVDVERKMLRPDRWLESKDRWYSWSELYQDDIKTPVGIEE